MEVRFLSRPPQRAGWTASRGVSLCWRKAILSSLRSGCGAAVARSLWEREALGSNPSTPTTFCYIYNIVTSGRQLTKKILIVEDEEPVARAPQLKLQRYGIESEIVPDGREALLRLSKENFDLITLDLILPKKDGREVLHQLRADSWGKSVPVIILTVLDADEKMLNEILAYHPAHYFIKSEWRLEDVIEKVKELVPPAGIEPAPAP